MPKYEYSGGVFGDAEKYLVEKFEDEVLPYALTHGSEIGERAMQGDMDAEEIIRRQRMFCEGLPHLRPLNFRLLVAALKRYESKRVN
jgi:hypothetical protein